MTTKIAAFHPVRTLDPIPPMNPVKCIWSALLAGLLAALGAASLTAEPVPLLRTEIAPARVERRGDAWFVEFEKAAYGTLTVKLPEGVAPEVLRVRVGEKLGADGTIDRKPPGSVNVRELTLGAQPEGGRARLEIPAKPYHRRAEPVKMPAEIGEVTPFRYAEIEGWPAHVPLDADAVRQLAVWAPFDDAAASFTSSDKTLNAVWELCRYTVKATTAFGVYIDGERERIPYEGDAYINLLSHYAVDLDPRVARATFDHLMAHPTWPTEWSLHLPMIAAADFWATGEPVLAARHWPALKKTLLREKARADGLLVASAIVDWPGGERDGYNDGVVDPAEKRQVGPMVNTVANAFYHHALRQMAELAHALGKADEARELAAEAERVRVAFHAVFFDAARGIYVDGEGSAHASLHANLFPLAFGLVPEGRSVPVADFVESRGMRCSVYGAQYLLEALYLSGRPEAALQLMTHRSERGWWRMIERGSTMTWEAWDERAKPNLTWNHAWGAAPGNIVARHTLGVRPLEPGYARVLIAPRPGGLAWANGRVPTPRGPVGVAWREGRLTVEVPPGATARVEWPLGVVRENVQAGRHEF